MKQIRVLLSLLLLSLFTAYQVSITMFTHVHYINGVLLVHSHPFDSDAQHSHSKTELVVIDSISDYHTLQVNTFAQLFVTNICYYSFQVDTRSSYPTHSPKRPEKRRVG